MANTNQVQRTEPVTSVPALPSDYAMGASGAAAVITYASIAGQAHVCAGLIFGYDSAPQAGAYIQIQDGSGNTVFQAPITAAGIGPFKILPRKGSIATAMIITLSAGGGAVNAYLNVDHYAEGP